MGTGPYYAPALVAIDVFHLFEIQHIVIEHAVYIWLYIVAFDFADHNLLEFFLSLVT